MRLKRGARGLRWWVGACLFAMLISAIAGLPLHAQDSYLSDAEVDKLRETAASAPERVMAFVEFVNHRIDRIEKLGTGRRMPGREEDIHDMMQQITSILDDLDDNLDDYSKRHWDIRKTLPKLLEATERWATELRTPPENQGYSVQRKLALEALGDVRESAEKMVGEQKAWFAAHPPGKEGPAKKE